MSSDDWERTWNARQAALESVLGPADNAVLHAVIPFHLGGQADVLAFSQSVPGKVFATCELLGEPTQKPNLLGTYELAIADRNGNDWGANVISHLARYTCDAVLQPGETMDIGSAVPPKSTISAFFFDDFKRMKYDGKDAGILLCIGLTSDEVKACRRGQRQQVYDALVAQKVFPYTNLFRQSVLKPTSGGFWRRLTGGA